MQLSLHNQAVSVALEGVDGCGKTTQLQCLADVFRSAGRDVLATRQPGGSETFNIRDILLNYPGICSKARHLLFAADNSQHIHDTVLPALETNQDVLIDRSIGSAYAYQGWGEGFGLERVQITYDWATNNFRPDLTIFMDMTPEEVVTRKQTIQDQTEADEIEKFGIEFQWRVYEGYRYLVEHNTSWVSVRADIDLSIQETTELLVAAINENLRT